MASEITLKYLHPSVKTYITTENYNYDTSVTREVLFVADVFEHGVDNQLQQVNTLSEYIFKYGEPNMDKFGQAGYNVERWLANGNSAVIMRLLPEDASYAHAVFNIQYKNATNGKTVVNADGNETKINDVYLRPLVTYIGVNNKSELLLADELEEDRKGYPTTDGYIDNFLFVAYPEGRGEFYNDLGFKIRLNPSYDGVLTSRVYTFEIIKFTGSSYDIVDGPYYVSFDPDAVDPNSQKSMYIENVINSYSEYFKVMFSQNNYMKLAEIINPDVDPYTIDVISGQSRILPDGSTETFFDQATGKDEDVHISLRKYSSNGIALQENGNYILNISNNDETTSDIVDIADNSRRVIYNNQKFVTDYMRGFYNWLIQDRIERNLSFIIEGSAENSYDELGGLLLEKVNNLIFANETNDKDYSYSTKNKDFKSSLVGRGPSVGNYSWYLRTQEIIQKDLKDESGRYIGADTSGYEFNVTNNGPDDVYTSTSQVINTITEDGYISSKNQHLISFYNNFMKYFQFVCNYDIYNNEGFVPSDDYLNASYYFNKVSDSEEIIYCDLNNNSSNNSKVSIQVKYISSGSADRLKKRDLTTGNYTLTEAILRQAYYSSDINQSANYINLAGGIYPSGCESNDKYYLKNVYIDDTISNNAYLIPIVDYTGYNSNKEKDLFGTYIKVYNLLGEQIYQPFIGTSLAGGTFIGSAKSNDFNKYLFDVSNIEGITSNLTCLSMSGNLYFYNKNKPSTSYCVPVNNLKNLFTDNQNCSLEFKTYVDIFKNIYAHFEDSNFANYEILYKPNITVVTPQGAPRPTGFQVSGDEITNITTYNDLVNIRDNNNGTLPNGIKQFSFVNLIKFLNEVFMNSYINEKQLPSTSIEAKFTIPGTETSTNVDKYTFITLPITAFEFDVYYNDDTDDINSYSLDKIFTNFYFKKTAITENFDNIFTTYLKNGKLTQAYNKVSSYASLISKELDGKGKDIIISDIEKAKDVSELDSSKYSLTTILNVLIGGFEAIVNNQGTITDYTNYSTLKYLIKTINNNLDLRSTYLTLLNVHKNNILDLSFDLAKNNASVILGDETLEKLYAAMDIIVLEANYLITNIVLTLLNTTYTIKDLDRLVAANQDPTADKIKDKDILAYYFNDNKVYNTMIVDSLGINNNIDLIGKDNSNTTTFYGIIPLLEKIIINITGQNHYGEARDTIYGGQALIQMYDDIKNGYVLGGLTQERYETMYSVLAESLSNLSDVHNIINAFINEKYITEIINNLIGTLNVNNTIIKYNGASYSINTLWNYYNSGIDSELTQTKVINLINNAIEVQNNANLVPIEPTSSVPIITYPEACIRDINDSSNIAKDNKNIVKNNIEKQDKVLASLNTLCYDNLVTNIAGPLGFSEGSDGSFTYDNSSTQKLKNRQHKINDIRIKAYKGTWNPDVVNKDLYEFDHVFDANYEDAVKNAIITLARDERQDFFFWADTKLQNTVQDTLNWKAGFTNSTYFMSITSQSQVWYDEYTSKNINLTSTYLLTGMLCNHLSVYGRHFPMAGSRRGVVGGFKSNDWYPNEEQKEKLYTNKVNYLERDVTTIRIGAQNTNYPTGPLGSINNMLVTLRIKRTVEKIAKTYQFEFNTSETRSTMAAEINNYLTTWVNNGACTVATANVYASDYDIIQKIVRVDITLQFTGVIERIVINIDCPARS